MPNERDVKLSRARLALAREEHEAAQVTFDAGLHRVANTRAYYSAFHAMRAVLALDGVDFKTHSRVIGYFNKNYVRSGIFSPIYSGVVAFASKLRNQSDYEDFFKASREETAENAEKAKAFVDSVAEYIEKRIESEYIQQELEDEEAANFEDEYDGGEFDEYDGGEDDEDDEDEWER